MNIRRKILIFLNVLLVLVFLFTINSYENPYSPIRALAYSITTFFTWGFFLIYFYLFLKIRFFRALNFKEILQFNFLQVFAIIPFYGLFIGIISEAIFKSFEPAIKVSSPLLYPERYFLILPATIGILLFLCRISFNSDIINDKNVKPREILFFEEINIKDIERLRNVLFGLLMGSYFLSLFAFFVLHIYESELLGDLKAPLAFYSFVYGGIFGFLDIVLGLTFSETPFNQWYTSTVKERKRERTQGIDFFKRHPKLKKFLVLAVLVYLAFIGYDSSKTSAEPFIREPVGIVAYEIQLNISELPENAIVRKSDEHFMLKKENLTVAVPLVEINGDFYPLTIRLAEKKRLIKYNDTDLYLVEEITPKLINMTYLKKDKNFDTEKIYYRSSKLDAFLFIALVENGYKRVTSYYSEETLRLSEVNPDWFPLAHKVYFCENSESNIMAYTLSVGELDSATLNLITPDSTTVQKIEKIGKIDENMHISAAEGEVKLEQIFTHREFPY